MIEKAGRGVVVLIREPSPTSLLNFVQASMDLGVKDMILLSNTQRTIVGLEGYGLTVVEQRPIELAEEEGA